MAATIQLKDQNWRIGPSDADGHPNPDGRWIPESTTDVHEAKKKTIVSEMFQSHVRDQRFSKVFRWEVGNSTRYARILKK
jgi:glycyl-tRNA synthetase beta subunit